MADKHDRVFKDLISNRDFAICFLMTYLPKELIALVDWQSVKLESANVEHVRQQQKDNKKQKEQSDLTFLFKFKDGKNGAVFVHIESQTGDDGTIVIRTRHYQTSYLLDYVKRHKTTKDLPLVVSIIYYANKKPFSHSLNINDYFANKELAEKYAFTTQFIDLNRYSDEEILEHGFISGYELILKAIREKNIDGKIGIAVHQIQAYDHFARQVLIRHMSQYSDMETDAFYDRIIDSKPDLKGDVMTVAQQWERQGEMKKAQETARTMLVEGLASDLVIKCTGLDLDTVLKLKNEVDSKTQH